MNSLDEENINPLRGNGAIVVQPSTLEDSILALSPSFTRMGLDMSVFTRASTSLKELPQTWRHFIAQQAKEILSGDIDRLLTNIDRNFETRTIKSSEINAIVNFVLSYYEVIHRRSINKKEVIEGVLMRGLIKKSSFYQKISVADKDQKGILSWDASEKQHDDIWRHFTLQTCRFLKQATGELDDLLEDAQGLREKLQKLLDRDEQEQFNQGTGKRSLGTFIPIVMFFLGIAGLMSLPMPTHETAGQPAQITTSSPSGFDATVLVGKSEDASAFSNASSATFASALSDEIKFSSANTNHPIDVGNATATVKFQP